MGAVSLRVIVILSVLLGLTAWQRPMWSSNERLWAVAVRLNTVSPRPTFNYGLALRQAGKFDAATEQSIATVQRVTGQPREADYRRAVQAQFMAMELTGVAVCDSDRVRPYC